jgi:hypothetical protein
MIWKPSVTVAAIVERDGRFLLVEEHTNRGQRSIPQTSRRAVAHKPSRAET